MHSSVLVFLLIGKLVLYLARKSPYLKGLETKGDFLKGLVTCDLCLGVWVYFALSLVMGHVWFMDVFYTPILSEAITGALASFVVYVFTNGWNTLFREMTMIITE